MKQTLILVAACLATTMQLFSRPTAPVTDSAWLKANTAFRREADPVKKENLLKEIVANFPETNKDKLPSFGFDEKRADVGLAYAAAGNFEKAKAYLDSIHSKTFKPGVVIAFVRQYMRDSNYVEAQQLYRPYITALDSTIAIRRLPAGVTQKLTAHDSYQYSLYADLLNKLHKTPEALVYAKKAYDGSNKKPAQIASIYAAILLAAGNHAEALPVLTDLYRQGMATKGELAQLKQTYIKVKGSDKGYEAYLAPYLQQLRDKMQDEAAKKIIKKAAPAFALKDMQGKMVSLQDLKGKVVVLDFWATWCGPCKASFPAMQMAVNKYKQDTTVQFLFIDVWEDKPDYEELVKKFITGNQYSFHVLYSPKDLPQGSTLTNAFDIKGILCKFVIDGNGDIRFSLPGFKGGDDAAVEELTAMIEMAKKAS